jgi:hypothetical protein
LHLGNGRPIGQIELHRGQTGIQPLGRGVGHIEIAGRSINHGTIDREVRSGFFHDLDDDLRQSRIDFFAPYLDVRSGTITRAAASTAFLSMLWTAFAKPGLSSAS